MPAKLGQARLLGLPPLVAAAVLTGLLAPGELAAQPVQQVVVGPNINVVGGPASYVPGRDPELIGDPFLQRQNEPSLAVSSRNPCHILAGANDYRAVELEEAFGEIGDAWLGVFKSFDCGFTWTSTLLAGHPVDTTAAGLASPLRGLAAAADPTVRAGTSGLFYYSGIAFNRGDGEVGKVFVARFIDNNNSEASDPIRYLGTAQIDVGTSGQFLDKPWIATDIPRGGATCTIGGQTIPAGPVYLVYTSFLGEGNNVHTKVLFSKSTDCGATWSNPAKLSERVARNQGTSIAVDPGTGAIYVVWREFSVPADANSHDEILFAMSTDGGKSFTKAAHVGPTSYELNPFDQASSFATFRTNAYPTIAVVPAEADNRTAGEPGRVYVAWAHQGLPFSSPVLPDIAEGESRVVYSTFVAGLEDWSPPVAADDIADGDGHQLMPSIAFAGGKLALAYYDLREDRSSLFEDLVFEGGLLNYTYCKSLFDAGGPTAYPSVVACLEAQARAQRLVRHTIDLRAAMADSACLQGGGCAFTSTDVWSTRASRYVSRARARLQNNPPNLPLFSKGRLPFIGDYIDLAGVQFLADSQGGWRWNTGAGADRPAPLFYVTWTDNRDVRRPSDADWEHFTPRSSASGLQCVPGQAGIRNQNVYTAQLRPSVVVSAPVNAKRISGFQRTFVVLVQNTTSEDRIYRLKIEKPTGVLVSFNQYTLVEAPVTELTLTIPRKSTASRTVFAQSETGGPTGAVTVPVTATDLGPVGGGGSSGGFDTIYLNPDFDNPDFDNPDFDNVELHNPDFDNPDFDNPDFDNVAFLTPDFDNPDFDNLNFRNPDFDNPDFDNPDFDNPDFDNPDFDNPDFDNPDFDNPDFDNPDFDNPDFDNAAIADVTWKFTNPSTNTTSAYNANLTLNLPPCTYVLQPGDDYGALCPDGYRAGSDSASCPSGEACIAVQFVARRLFPSPSYRILNGQCLPEARSHQNQALTNIYRYDPRANTDAGQRNDETFYLAPGQSGLITLRVYGEVGQQFFNNWFGAPGNVEGVTLKVTPQAANCSACVGGECGEGDNVGQTTECQAQQTEIFDKIPPVLTLPANVMGTEATSPAGAAVSFASAPSAQDDVDGPLSPTCAPASGATFALGTTTVNCSATDAAGNVAVGSFTVTVVDRTAPVVIVSGAPTAAVEGNALGGATVVFTASATDTVDGSVSVSCSPISGSVFPLGTTTVTCTASDLRTPPNTGSASFTVTVGDTTPPSLPVPADITVEATSPSGAPVSFTATASDIADASVEIVCTPASGAIFALGTTTVSCTATDDSGNSTSAAFTVTVRDTTAPAFGDPPFSFPSPNPNGWYSTEPVTGTVNVTDSTSVDITCTDSVAGGTTVGGTTITVSADGMHAIKCTATDQGGNSTGANVQINIDATPPGAPVLSFPPTPGSGWFTGPVTGTVTASDLSGAAVSCTDDGAPLPLTAGGFTVSGDGPHTVSCTATNLAGLSSAAGSGTVQLDTAGPVFTPATIVNLTLEATGSDGAAASFAPAATDAMSGGVTITCTWTSGSTFPLGTTTVSCTATDAAGNLTTASFSVHVVDTTAPVIASHADVSAEATSASGALVSYTSPSWSDVNAVSGSGTASCALGSGSLFALGNTTVTCNASDGAGNPALATTFVVHVVDTTPPAIASHADETAEATGASGAVVLYASPGWIDAVSGTGTASCSPASGSTFALGATTVTCTVTDSAGNSSASTFSVTVHDTTAPVLTVPANITGVQATGPSGAGVTYTVAATDIVDTSVTVACSSASGATFPLGTTTVSCTAADDAGNTAPGSFTVTVVDTTPPAVTLNGASSITLEAGTSFVDPGATATDIVSGPVAVAVSGSVNVFVPGVYTLTYSATDGAGNTGTATRQVAVVDTQPPATLTASVNPSLLWPPDGTIVPVTVSGQVSDAGSGAARIDWVVIDEYNTYKPTGSVTVTNGPYNFQVPLLRDRRGNDKDGRHYTIKLTAYDKAGNAKVLANPLVVNVHDQSGK